MAMIWKRFRPAPEAAREDMYSDLGDRLRARGEDRVAGVLDLLYELRHPLVRAAMTASRRRRAALAAAFGAVALAVFLAVVALALVKETQAAAPWVGVVFVCAWPLVAFFGTSLDAGATVISERENNTALQLVLTPVSKRPIAAAKVLPAAWPYMIGMLAALPLYVTIGGAHPFMHDLSVPSPMLFWPLRIFAPALGCEMEGISVAGFFVGLLMLMTDIATVWAAAHWGAAYGVRLGQLPTVAMAALWRLVLTLLYLGVILLGSMLACFAASMTVGMIVSFFSPLTATAIVAAAGLWAFVVLWRRYYMNGPIRMLLIEFSHFDELAQDDYEPRPLRGWAIFKIYGQRT